MLTATTPPARSMRRTLLRVCLVAAIVGVVLAAAPVVWARFSASRSNSTSTISAATVTLTTQALTTCSVTGMLPNTTAGPCTLKATYSGTAPAYLGLDVLVATKSGSPGNTALYNPADASNDLQITITDNQGSPVTYVTPSTSFGSALASCPAGSGFDSSYTCYRLTNLLVSTSAFTSATAADTFSTSVSLPSSNPTGYQGGTAAIALTVHAVQSGNQTLGGCTAGSPCSGIGWN